MRNLKKILALALALVMTLSVMSVASAKTLGEYADASSVSAKHELAVNVATQLGILEGVTETNYAPQGTLTRAQLATMIYRITTGDVKGTYVSNFAAGAAAKFEDVKVDAWYAGYVGYCADAGYLQGWDGKYAPNNTLTGYQALAALLRAIGYNQPGEFTGADWTVRVAQIATQAKVSVGVVADLNKAITREQAAQFIYNALFANEVEYTPAFGYATVAWMSDTPSNLLKSTFKYSGTGMTYDAFGRPTEVWYNTNSAKIVVLPVEAAATYTTAVTGCELLKALGYAEYDPTPVTFTTYTNGVGTGHVATVNSSHNSITACAAKSHVYGAQGQLMEVYPEATANTFRIVYVDTYLAQIGLTSKAITAHDAYDTVALNVFESNNVGVAKSYSYLTGTKSYTKGAYALVTMADGVVKSVTEVAPAASAVGTYWLNTAAGQTTIVGGVTYNDANKFFVGQNTWDAVKTWNVYTDSYGNIIGLVEYVAPNTYAYGVITAMKWVDTNDLLNSGYVLSNIVKMDATTMANTILADNTLTATVGFSSNGALLGDYDDDKVSESTQYNGEYADTLFQYTLNPNGSYNITAKAAQVAGTVNIKTGVANLWTAEGQAMATNDYTVYLVKTMAGGVPTYTTYTGYKNVPSMNGVTVEFLKAATGAGVYTDYVYVDATTATYDGAAGYVWFTKDLTAADAIGKNATGDNAYLAYVEGVATVVYLDAATEAATLTSISTGNLYVVTRNADGDITSAEALDSEWAPTGTTYRSVAGVTGITGTVITNGNVEGTLNVTGASVYVYSADMTTVTPVAEANWSAAVVNQTNPKTAYCVIGVDGIVDAIYVIAG